MRDDEKKYIYIKIIDKIRFRDKRQRNLFEAIPGRPGCSSGSPCSLST